MVKIKTTKWSAAAGGGSFCLLARLMRIAKHILRRTQISALHSLRREAPWDTFISTLFISSFYISSEAGGTALKYHDENRALHSTS